MKNNHYIGLCLATCFSVQFALAQKFFSKNGHTDFMASVESFEAVAAKNKSTTVLLNTTNGELAALLFVKAFHFEIALMEEHFNENYMESDEYPKATFKGVLLDFDFEKLSEKAQKYLIEGEINIHGQSKTIQTVATLISNAGKIHLDVTFEVKPEDFGIEIPSIVREKIAKTIQIKLDYVLEPKV